MKRSRQQHQTESAYRHRMQNAQPSGGTMVAAAADNSASKNNRKKLIVIFMCLFICAILIFALSRMKYTTPEMRGKVAYEPALFNTVLLGNLVQLDLDKLKQMESVNYTISENDQTYDIVATGKKLEQSLTLSSANELGTTQSTGNFAQVAPGDSGNAHVEFIITNGTTVADDTTTADAENKNYPLKKKNVAESDIRYTIHIITTENLPLTYQIKDMDCGNIYSLTEASSGNTEQSGDYKDYIIDSVASSGKASLGANQVIFHNGSRILKCNSDGSITVHRYQLLVNWPITEDGTDDSSRDTRYMKELENVEIRVEVESYVNHLNATTDVSQKAEGILVLQNPSNSAADTAKFEEYAASGLKEIFADKTVRYDNLSDAVDGGTSNDKLSEVLQTRTANKKVSDYTFHICNGDSVAKTWVSDKEQTVDYTVSDKEAVSPTRKENGQTTRDGHYTYSGTYKSGEYKIALAVPVGTGEQKASVSSVDRTQGMTYYLEYNGQLYIGKVSTNDKVTTKKWTKRDAFGNNANNGNDSDTVKNSKVAQSGKKYTYEEETATAYQLLKFYPVSGENEQADTTQEMTLQTFTSDEFQSQSAKLYVVSEDGYTYHSSKDDFRIFVYQD